MGVSDASNPLKRAGWAADLRGVRDSPNQAPSDPPSPLQASVAGAGDGSALDERLPLGQALVERGLLSQDDLARALDHQSRTGGRLGQILVATGVVRRQDLYRVLSAQWNLPFADLTTASIDPELIRHLEPARLVAIGMFPMSMVDGILTVAIVDPPRFATEDEARDLVGAASDVAVRLVATTEWDLDWAVREHFAERLESDAKWHLARTNAGASAHVVVTRGQKLALAAGAAAVVAAAMLTPGWTFLAVILAINLLFTAGILFKFTASLAGVRSSLELEISDDDVAALTDAELPVYTVLVPVYHEANVVGLLMENLAGLDYPAEKLEILLLLEDDDTETIAAARAAAPARDRALHRHPRRASRRPSRRRATSACFFARGEFAGDLRRRGPPRARAAARRPWAAFRHGRTDDWSACRRGSTTSTPPRTCSRACSRSSTRFWFDYMLPGLDRAARCRSRSAARPTTSAPTACASLGGWDPFNVTEDADLGLRAAVAGLHASA